MALHIPPEVLLRPLVRALHLNPQKNNCVSKRFYKAAVCTKFGLPLEIKEIPMPDKIPDNKILIATHSAGVGFADILIVQGKYQVRIPPPFIPGVELVGYVESTGRHVEKFKKGDRVIAVSFAMNAFGEYCLVDSDNAFLAPDKLSMVDAAGTLISYGTAMMALSRTTQLQKGETVLVTAAAGATGLAVADVALNVFDAKVIGVCGSAEKCALLQQRGVLDTINYRTEKIQERVKEITGGRGVDVVVDQVGGDTFTDCLKSIAFEGRLVTVGYASGQIPSVQVNRLLLKSCSIRGMWWGDYHQQHPEAFTQSITDVLNAFSQGKLHPYTGKTFSLPEVNAAFDYILSRQSTGKVILKIRD